MADCAELLRRYAEDRSEVAFAELVRQHVDRVFASALRQLNGDRALAQEVTQTVFTDLARKARLVAERPTVLGWIYRSTQFAAAAAVRSEQRRRRREGLAQALPEWQPAPAAAADWEDLRPLLDRALGQLSERDREALVLRFFEGRTFAAIGQRLGLRENAARMRVERALEKVRVRLGQLGVTSSAAALAGLLSAPAAVPAPAGLAGAVAGQALAASSAGGSALSWLPFMSTTQSALSAAGVLGIAAILCLPSLGVAVRVRAAARREQLAWTQAHDAYEGERAQLRQRERQAAAAERRLTELRQRGGGVGSGAGGGAAVTGGGKAAGPTGRNPKAEGQKFLAAFPQARPLLAEVARGQFAGNYAPYFHQAGLAAEQIDQLEGAVADSWVSNLQIAAGTVTNLPGVDDLSPGQLRQILGDTAAQQLEDYDRGMQAYVWAGKVATAVAYTAAPLTPDQSDQLAQMVMANSPGYLAGQKLDPTAVDWTAVQTQAQKIFSTAQWPAVAGVFAGLQFQQAAAQAP